MRHRFERRAAAAGTVAGLLGTALGMRGLDPWLVGWCAHVVAWGVLQYRALWCGDPDTLRRRARALAGGRRVRLALSLLGAGAAMLAVTTQLEGSTGSDEKALVAATVLLSWACVQMRFVQDYAHECWTRGEGPEFRGSDGAPDVSEFVYVALNVGCALQVSDTVTTGPGVRRLVSLHTVVAFLFNAVTLAATINLLAGSGR